MREDRILLVRLTYGWASGRWVIPNGAVHAGETLAEAALRELQEEAGLRGKAGAVVAVRSLASDLGTDTFVALRVNATGEPSPDGREVDKARFFDRVEIGELEASDRIVRMHRLIAERLLPGRSPALRQTLDAFDREGNPARAALYLT
jgi:8-oxo-dGTP pyrophosphatase MutT (NUDIX family)